MLAPVRVPSWSTPTPSGMRMDASGSLPGGLELYDRVLSLRDEPSISVAKGDVGTVLGPCNNKGLADSALRVLVDFGTGKGFLNVYTTCLQPPLPGKFQKGDRVCSLRDEPSTGVLKEDHGTVMGPCKDLGLPDEMERVLVDFGEGKGMLSLHHTGIKRAQFVDFLRLWIGAGHDVNAPASNIFAMMGHSLTDIIDTHSSLLWSSCECHDEDAVRMLVQAHADLNMPNAEGIPPLSACCMYDGSPACLSLLLESKAVVDQLHTRSQATPLLVASHDGNTDCVQRLIAARASVNHQQLADGFSALHMCCETGYDDCVEVLLAASADANLKSSARFTPLILASQNGHARCLEMVLAASSEATREAINSHGANAMVMACQNGHLLCMLRLLAAGCQPQPPTYFEAPAMLTMNAACIVGHSALLYALLAHGVHPDTGSKIAMFLSLEYGHLECVMLLSSVGASRELEQNGHKWLAHEVALECEQPHIAAWLHGSHDWTPLHHLEVCPVQRVRRMLRAGADVHAKRGRPACTPVQRARDLSSLGTPSEPPARVLLDAASPWSPRNHTLFPAASRRIAAELLCIGLRLRDRLMAAGRPGAASWSPDIWVQNVIPHAVTRAQCRQEGCFVLITGLLGSAELNGKVGMLASADL